MGPTANWRWPNEIVGRDRAIRCQFHLPVRHRGPGRGLVEGGAGRIGLVGGIFFLIIIGMWMMKQVLPFWYVGLRLLSITVTSAVGGYVAYRVGNRLKDYQDIEIGRHRE